MTSSIRTTKKRHPQGLPLSPTLFNRYVADMPTLVKDKSISIFKFADDTALVARDRYLDIARGYLEWAIVSILNFAEDWKMKINQGKTEVLRF